MTTIILSQDHSIKPLKIWNLKDGTLLQNLKHGNDIYHFVVTKDNRYIVTASYDSTAKIWNLKDGTLIHTIEGDSVISHVSLIDNDKRIVTGSWNGTVSIWNFPETDLDKLLENTGRRSNYRICKNTLKAIPVLPFPDPMSVWAPNELCQSKSID